MQKTVQWTWRHDGRKAKLTRGRVWSLVVSGNTNDVMSLSLVMEQETCRLSDLQHNMEMWVETGDVSYLDTIVSRAFGACV